MMKTSHYIIVLLLILNCNNPTDSTDDMNFLELYLETTINEEGYYLVDYPDDENNSYITVKYRSLPMTRVFWTTPDSFTVDLLGVPITEPIINYSTYTSSDSTGQQSIYLYQDFLGDTLSIIGTISENLYQQLKLHHLQFQLRLHW